ncbi:Protein Wfdc21, partial [Eschrichtius robustus]|nr:Protein Wfdc21 [Eschrichtius robustus]
MTQGAEEDKFQLFSSPAASLPKTSDSSMKLGGFLLLVTLVVLSSEVQELQAAVRPYKLLGTCIELCSGDWDCGPEEHCVSNGCGHKCVSD